jgi:ubiquinol-cytochrome c reductase iron-sulfur subunit
MSKLRPTAGGGQGVAGGLSAFPILSNRARRQALPSPGLPDRTGPAPGFPTPREDAILTTDSVSEPSRRDFLYLATGAVGAVGAGSLAWPFIHQMNPDASALALSSIEVDVSQIKPGQIVTVKWRGKPVFIRNRTPEEMKKEAETPIADLRDPETDKARVKPGHESLLIVVGVCTHLGCIPLGHQGDYEGWFCPCHGSHYDASGRVRKGPAPKNLEVPAYAFLNDKVVKIG